MSRLWIPQLFAYFKADTSLASRDNGVTERHRMLTRRRCNYSRQIVLFDLTRLRPGGEPTCLTVIAIVTHHHFGPNEHDFLVVEHDTTIIGDIEVHHRHADIDEHALRVRRHQDLKQDLPAV